MFYFSNLQKNKSITQEMSRTCSSGSIIAKFNRFLKSHKKQIGMSFTHTSISKPRGSYYIDYMNEDVCEEFFELYYHFVFVAQRECFMTEAMKHDVDYTPIRVDLDFRKFSAGEEPERLYAIDDIIKVCHKYFTEMKKFFIVEEDDEKDYAGRCFIMEKESPSFATTKNNRYRIDEETGHKLVKDGIHFMFPNVSASVAVQLHLRNLVYKNIGPILDHCEYQNSYADIFDKAVIDRNNWLMYGSKKKPGDKAYVVTHIVDLYDDIDKTQHIDLMEYTNRDLVSLLSIRNKDFLPQILAEAQNHVDVIEDKYLEMETRRLQYTNSVDSKKKKAAIASVDVLALVEGGFMLEDGRGTRTMIPGLLNCLSDKRKVDYTSWIEVGFALHNIDNSTKSETTGEVRLLEAWHRWSTSKGSGHYEGDSIETCRREWSGFRNDGLKLGSLKMWARKDAAEKHSQLVRQGLKRHNELDDYQITMKMDNWQKMNDILNKMKKKPNEYAVAEMTYSLFNHVHRLVSLTSNTWFYFDERNHRWKTDENGHMLRKKISMDLWKRFLDKRTQIQEERKVLDNQTHANYVEEASRESESGRLTFNLSNNTNDKKSQELKDIADKCDTVMTHLRNDRFLKVVMSHCAQDVGFYDQEQTFNTNLDSNVYLLGFTNGVYDLQCNKFRAGVPEDMIQMSTNIKYIPYDEHAKEVREIKKFLREILPIKSVRNYVLHFLSTVLEGTTSNEKFVVWSGSGGNGKSKLVELVNSVLGDYKCIMNVGVLTQKRGAANGPSPELHKTKGTRFVTLHEPDTDSTLNVGLMKGMTGGDEITARGLNKDPISFKPQFKMVICCNDKPKLPPNDGGVWRRIALVEFVSKFVDAPKGHYEYPNGKVWLDPNIKPPQVKYNSEKGVYQYPNGTIWTEPAVRNIPKNVTWIPDSKTRPQFPRDIHLDAKFATWKEHFMAYLLHVHKQKSGVRLREPPEVLKWTNKYRKENDHFSEFMESKICVEENVELDIMSMTEIYAHYTQWYTDTHADRNKKTMKELKEFLIEDIPDNHQRIRKQGKNIDYFRLKIVSFDEMVNAQTNSQVSDGEGDSNESDEEDDE